MAEPNISIHRLVIELHWSWRVALALAAAVALPLLALTGILTALARPGLGASAAVTTAPTVLSYQGRVSVNGSAFDGTGQFKFAIVSATGSTAYWTNDGTGLGAAPFQPSSAVTLSVSSGQFNVLLGNTALPNMTQPITAGVFLQPSRALRVWFNDGATGFQQLAPDVTLAAVPYALNAETLDGLDSSAFAAVVHTHSGGDIVSGTIGDARLSSNVIFGGQNVSRLTNDAGYLTAAGVAAAGYLTQTLADARYARIGPTTQQIALLKWYTAISSTQSFAVGSNPSSLAFDGTNIWVVNNGSGTVSVLSASNGTYVMTPPWALHLLLSLLTEQICG